MTPAASQTKLSAVVVCYRDAPAVPIMHERLTKVFTGLGVDYEIIFVNDASPDNAREVLADLAGRDRKVVVINHTRNFGSQSGFTSGMRVATGDAVILLDGDLQDPPELIEDFVREWRQGYQVVYGVRVQRDAPMLMRGAYKLFYRIFRALSYVRVPVDAGDFSLLATLYREHRRGAVRLRGKPFAARGDRLLPNKKAVALRSDRPGFAAIDILDVTADALA